MYFDGAMNILKNGTRVEIISLNGRKYPISIMQEFECTNNIMVCGACIHGLKVTLEIQVRKLDVYGGSMLINYKEKR